MGSVFDDTVIEKVFKGSITFVDNIQSVQYGFDGRALFESEEIGLMINFNRSLSDRSKSRKKFRKIIKIEPQPIYLVFFWPLCLSP